MAVEFIAYVGKIHVQGGMEHGGNHRLLHQLATHLDRAYKLHEHQTEHARKSMRGTFGGRQMRQRKNSQPKTNADLARSTSQCALRLFP